MHHDKYNRTKIVFTPNKKKFETVVKLEYIEL